jgi:aspartyl/asparaginyl-tRNA synthetase
MCATKRVKTAYLKPASLTGCNHMTCAGCKAHVCWVYMAVFDIGGPCYAHMTKAHGGIGLGLERFMN